MKPIKVNEKFYLAHFFIAGSRWVYLFLGEKPIIERAMKRELYIEKRRGAKRREIPAYILREVEESKAKATTLYLALKKLYPKHRIEFVVIDHKGKVREYISPYKLIEEEVERD